MLVDRNFSRSGYGDQQNIAQLRDIGLYVKLFDKVYIPLADFAFSDIVFFNKGMLPVRWMALESLEEYTYTTKTDV